MTDGRKVFCYYNLHKHLFSLRNTKTNRVEIHSNIVFLKDCKFKVSQKGRERVLKEKRKNIHAGVRGTLDMWFKECDISPELFDEYVELTYNPYLYDSFVVKENGKKVREADEVFLYFRKVFAKGIKYDDSIVTN